MLFSLLFSYENQIVQVTPQEPEWGDTICVRYNPKAKGAKFLIGDDVYLSTIVSFPKKGESRCYKMKRRGELFEYKLPVKRDASFISFYFLTLDDGWDKNAITWVMVYKEDGVPARGACIEKMFHFPQHYKELFEREIGLYPDNWMAYKRKWRVMKFSQVESLPSVIKGDIKTLSQKRTSPELLSTLSYGYLLLGEEKRSRELLKELMERFPESPLIQTAIETYEYEVFSRGIKGEGPEEIERLKQRFIEKYPEYGRREVYSLVYEKECPLRLIEKICKPWIKEEPDNPLPYFNLAKAYLKKGRNLKRASQLISKAIPLLLEGKLRLYMDISGNLTKRLIPEGFKTSAEINLALNNYSQALSDIKAAQAFQRETVPEYYITEGNIWQGLKNYSEAEESYLEALRRGSEEAEDSLKSIYKRKHRTEKGFEDYLKKKEFKKPSKQAPDFEVTSIDGKHYKLSKLKGKVVVLNFWSIGCVPCRVEIPSLNRLTEEFKGKDVVFLGLAMDGEERLEKFLKKKPFNYKIIPDAGEVAKLYEVGGFPTHIIIDKEGRMAYRLTGGAEERDKELKPLIERLLGK